MSYKSTVTIEHSEARGTVLYGTCPGDGSAEIVESLGWQSGPSAQMWSLPQSRGMAPNWVLITETGDRLLAAGFEVWVSEVRSSERLLVWDDL